MSLLVVLKRLGRDVHESVRTLAGDQLVAVDEPVDLGAVDPQGPSDFRDADPSVSDGDAAAATS